MDIEFLSTVAVITPDTTLSRKLYVETLGLPLEGQDDGYHHSEQIAGCKSFGIWPLSQAAQACFGTDEWPTDRPVPQASIEFDVPRPSGRRPRRAGAPTGRLRAPTRTSRGAVGTDGHQAAIARGRDRRDLAHPHVPRRELTGMHRVGAITQSLNMRGRRNDVR